MLRGTSSPKSCGGFNIRGGIGIARAHGKFEAIRPIFEHVHNNRALPARPLPPKPIGLKIA
jgi:hypothetical protein